MATPGLTPVVGTTPLRVTDAQARDDARPPRRRPSMPRERTAAPDTDPDDERADSYTHDESATGDDSDRAEQVRRLLERAMARAERSLGNGGGEDATDDPTPAAPATPAPPVAHVAPVTPSATVPLVTAAPPAVDLTARYRSSVVVEPPTHAIDRIG